MTSTHIFGPALSHRLGLSLGIDLVPFKTCSYNCTIANAATPHRRSLPGRTFFPQKR
ncbi:MAG: hypothetical protein A4E34_02177 [Methanoregula sp. PtaU1.Bin006]|uniref:hypothetical protein n=1 Tax=Methanoregula sp. PtaU1.Bin006 TaxID=1811681 RepID=UPI0009CA6B5E|nr:hypothetical protein [Methanoregula sp. PtaU1.Bin006]OPY32800.1 MAG: hypothetical protein A4E34_02177 [Methanoregula sp. PtaU1.Bin006]